MLWYHLILRGTLPCRHLLLSTIILSFFIEHTFQLCISLVRCSILPLSRFIGSILSPPRDLRWVAAPSHRTQRRVILLQTLPSHFLLLHRFPGQSGLDQLVTPLSLQLHCILTFLLLLHLVLLLKVHHVVSVEFSLVEWEDPLKLIESILSHLNVHLLAEETNLSRAQICCNYRWFLVFLVVATFGSDTDL